MKKRTFIFVVVALGLLGGRMVSHERYPDLKTPPVANLTTAQLVKAYQYNETIYDGKRIRVRGVVSKVGDDHLRLAVTTVLLGPRLELRRSAKTADYRVGDKVSFLCTGDGTVLEGITLKRCDYAE